MSESNLERYRRYAREAERRAKEAQESARIWWVAAELEKDNDNA